MELTFSPIIPMYDGGKTAPDIYNAGNMTAHDNRTTTSEDCPMMLVTETNGAEFKAYVEKLKQPVSPRFTRTIPQRTTLIR